MTTSTARRRHALPWFFLVALSGIALAACSGGSVDNSSTGGAPIASGPGSSTPPDSNTEPDPDPTYPPGTTPTPAPIPSGPVAATDTTVALTWQPNSDPIAGYVVYYGPTPEAATTLATQLSLSSNGMNPQAPSVSFNAGTDLGLNYGDSVCFRLRAYNSANVMSDWSGAACGTI